jgi:hypothetical protein
MNPVASSITDLFNATCVIAAIAVLFSIITVRFTVRVGRIDAKFIRQIVRDELDRIRLERAGSTVGRVEESERF